MNPERQTRPEQAAHVRLECSECGNHSVTTALTPHTFTYGTGPEAVKLTTTVPLRTCASCGFQFLDKEGQDARHEAVCRHLGVLTPVQVRALRELQGLSRAELARLTGLGEATIARWERGALVQNVANDRYLRLLGYDENLERLRAWTDRKAAPLGPREDKKPTFGSLTEERTVELRVEQTLFRLSLPLG